MLAVTAQVPVVFRPHADALSVIALAPVPAVKLRMLPTVPDVLLLPVVTNVTADAGTAAVRASIPAIPTTSLRIKTPDVGPG